MKSTKTKKSATQHIGVQQTDNIVSVKVSLNAKIIKDDETDSTGIYVVTCQALDLSTQGDSIEEAKANIAEAVEMFLEACIERKVLGEVLTDCGFYEIADGAAHNKTRKRPCNKNSRRKMPPLPSGDVAHQFTVPVELPVMAFNGG